MTGYIYITTNLINNKKYIGRKTAEQFDKNYFGSGVGLKKALLKYGKENFNVELLKECFSIEELIESEMFFIKLYNAVEDKTYYNQSYGGYQEGFIPGDANIAKRPDIRLINSQKHKGKKMSDAFKKRQSELHIGKPSGMLGHTQSDSARKKISEAAKNQVHTAKRDEAVSKHHKGSKMMTNGEEQHWVFEADIQKMLDLGWWFGSCKKRNKRKNK